MVMFIRVAALAILLALPAGCGPRLVQTDVTRFTTLAPTDSAHSFTILPDEHQRGSLEFQHYAEGVAGSLSAAGWRPVPATVQAEAVVWIHWGMGPPHTTTWTESLSAWGEWGPGPWPWHGGFAQPFPAWETYSRTDWPKWLEVRMDDGPAWRSGARRTLFEGRAVTEGTQGTIAPVMPFLVRALFTGFPGINGQTIRVAVPVD
jgi:hypothetical protein